MKPTPIVSLAAAAATAIALAGCLSIHNPDNNPAASHSTTTAMTATNPTPAPERGGTIPRRAARAQHQLVAGAGAGTPTTALERFATVWSNWTAATVVAHQRQLAGISLGQARAQAEQAIASLEHDQTLARSQVANRGRVVAIAPALNTPGQWVVVTSETTTGQGDYSGLPPTLHVTYAQLTHTKHGYVVSQWSPRL